MLTVLSASRLNIAVFDCAVRFSGGVVFYGGAVGPYTGRAVLTATWWARSPGSDAGAQPGSAAAGRRALLPRVLPAAVGRVGGAATAAAAGERRRRQRLPGAVCHG